MNHLAVRARRVSALFAFCAVLAASPLLGQVPEPVVRSMQAVGILWQSTPSGPGTVSTSKGSCTYLGCGYVLTSCHVVENLNAPVAVNLTRLDFASPGRVVYADRGSDVAVVQLEQSPPIEGVPMATQSPQVGERLWYTGHPLGSSELQYIDGQVAGYTVGERASFFGPKGVPQGMSGGAVFDSAGRLHGPLWGAAQDGTVSYCVRTEITRPILTQFSIGGT